MKNTFKKLFYKYERKAGFAFLVGGFIFDTLTLQRIDLLWENLVFIFYLTLVFVGIVAINAKDGKYTGAVSYAMQFAFGGLFSGFLVFYSRSGSLTASFPFFLMLSVFFVGNEFFREKYKLFNFRLAVFFVAVFSYFTFSFPILLRRLGADIFVLSGLASLAVIFLLSVFLKRKANFLIIGGIYLLFNILYFTNLIPPIPLSLKEGGIYRFVERANEDYILHREEWKWYEFWRANEFKFRPGEPLYAYTAIFAPTKIEAQIFHSWSFFDEEKNEWMESVRIGFPIAGGRDGGYRGYSVKESVWPGKWRVDAVNSRGQIIGRIKFDVI